MNHLLKNSLLLLLANVVLVLMCGTVSAQRNVSGYVFDEENSPVPFVNVYLRETGGGTVTDMEGRYFLTLQPGNYTLVFTAIGYEELRVPIVVRDQDLVKNVWVKTSVEELDAVVVRAQKRDPAYGIIKNAIDHKDEFKTQVNSQRCYVYVKATEVITQKEKERRKRKQEEEVDEQELDPFEAEKKKKALEPRINLMEVEMTLNFQAPDKYKEERTAFKSYGSRSGLFLPRFDETNFNFYENLVYLKGIAETPVISPLSTTSILTYKFKLVESNLENGRLVYKIEVIPRKKGNNSCRGFIYINDSLWNINRIDLEVYKGALKFYDAFEMKIDYTQVSDTLWLINRQEFIYSTKDGRFTTFNGNTTMKISAFEIDYPFPPKFFKHEIAVTTQEAYDRDSTYWQKIRPEPLKPEEQRMIRRSDSVKAIRESQEFKDSMEALYNKVTLSEVLYDGVGFRKGEERWLFMSSLLSLTEFQIVGGFRFGPYFTYFKRFKSTGRFFITSVNVNVGVKNADPQGNFSLRYRYDPMKFADLWFYVGRNFSSINWFDAYLNQLKVSNYILVDNLNFGTRRELVNGLFAYGGLSFQDRRSVEQYDSKTFINRLVGDPDPLSFDNYQSFTTTLELSYTPAQRYITEPNRKIIVGSRYPTFTIEHRKGWPKVMSSDANYDYLEFNISQKVPMGIFGSSHYRFTTGTFVNTKELPFIDYKRFRQSDPWLYSNPLYSFQLLDTALAISRFFYETHYIHHFNGAIINNVPLLKLTRIQVVAGGGFLYVPGDRYRYEELFAGVERTFKLGARRRLRVGVFGVVANSSIGQVRPGYKFSLDIIDTWKQNWSF